MITNLAAKLLVFLLVFTLTVPYPLPLVLAQGQPGSPENASSKPGEGGEGPSESAADAAAAAEAEAQEAANDVAQAVNDGASLAAGLEGRSFTASAVDGADFDPSNPTVNITTDSGVTISGISADQAMQAAGAIADAGAAGANTNPAPGQPGIDVAATFEVHAQGETGVVVGNTSGAIGTVAEVVAAEAAVAVGQRAVSATITGFGSRTNVAPNVNAALAFNPTLFSSVPLAYMPAQMSVNTSKPNLSTTPVGGTIATGLSHSRTPSPQVNEIFTEQEDWSPPPLSQTMPTTPEPTGRPNANMSRADQYAEYSRGRELTNIEVASRALENQRSTIQDNINSKAASMAPISLSETANLQATIAAIAALGARENALLDTGSAVKSAVSMLSQEKANQAQDIAVQIANAESRFDPDEADRLYQSLTSSNQIYDGRISDVRTGLQDANAVIDELASETNLELGAGDSLVENYFAGFDYGIEDGSGDIPEFSTHISVPIEQEPDAFSSKTLQALEAQKNFMTDILGFNPTVANVINGATGLLSAPAYALQDAISYTKGSVLDFTIIGPLTPAGQPVLTFSELGGFVPLNNTMDSANKAVNLNHMALEVGPDHAMYAGIIEARDAYIDHAIQSGLIEVAGAAAFGALGAAGQGIAGGMTREVADIAASRVAGHIDNVNGLSGSGTGRVGIALSDDATRATTYTDLSVSPISGRATGRLETTEVAPVTVNPANSTYPVSIGQSRTVASNVYEGRITVTDDATGLPVSTYSTGRYGTWDSPTAPVSRGTTESLPGRAADDLAVNNPSVPTTNTTNNVVSFPGRAADDVNTGVRAANDNVSGGAQPSTNSTSNSGATGRSTISTIALVGEIFNAAVANPASLTRTVTEFFEQTVPALSRSADDLAVTNPSRTTTEVASVSGNNVSPNLQAPSGAVTITPSTSGIVSAPNAAAQSSETVAPSSAAQPSQPSQPAVTAPTTEQLTNTVQQAGQQVEDAVNQVGQQVVQFEQGVEDAVNSTGGRVGEALDRFADRFSDFLEGFSGGRLSLDTGNQSAPVTQPAAPTQVVSLPDTAPAPTTAPRGDVSPSATQPDTTTQSSVPSSPTQPTNEAVVALPDTVNTVPATRPGDTAVTQPGIQVPPVGEQLRAFGDEVRDGLNRLGQEIDRAASGQSAGNGIGNALRDFGRGIRDVGQELFGVKPAASQPSETFNFANIKEVPGNYDLIGAVPDASGTFLEFADTTAAGRALLLDLGNKIERGLDTLNKITPEYSPASDGNNPGRHARTIASIADQDLKSGFNADTPITPDDLKTEVGVALIKGFARAEEGIYLTTDQAAKGSAAYVALPSVPTTLENGVYQPTSPVDRAKMDAIRNSTAPGTSPQRTTQPAPVTVVERGVAALTQPVKTAGSMFDWLFSPRSNTPQPAPVAQNPAPVNTTPAPTTTGGKVVMVNGNATRDRDITTDLEKQLSYAGKEAGVDVYVYSGGQASLDDIREGRAHPSERVPGSSPRHDDHGHGGGAADLYLADPVTGRTLKYTDPNDLPRIVLFVEAVVKAGATGIGAGPHYMGGQSNIHVGGGPIAIWAKKDVSTPPGWLREAHRNGLDQAKTFDLDEYLARRVEEPAPVVVTETPEISPEITASEDIDLSTAPTQPTIVTPNTVPVSPTAPTYTTTVPPAENSNVNVTPNNSTVGPSGIRGIIAAIAGAFAGIVGAIAGTNMAEPSIGGPSDVTTTSVDDTGTSGYPTESGGGPGTSGQFFGGFFSGGEGDVNASSTSPTIEVLVQIDANSGDVYFDILGAYDTAGQPLADSESYAEFEPEGEAVMATDSAPSIVLDDKNRSVVYSDGTYAPVVLDGVWYQSKDDPRYVYAVEIYQDGQLVQQPNNGEVLPGNAFTKFLGDLFNNTETFYINNVREITRALIDPDEEVLADEYYVYRLYLAGGDTRSVTVPRYTSYYFLTQRFGEVGFSGNVLALVATAVDIPAPVALGDVASGVATTLREAGLAVMDLFRGDESSDGGAIVTDFGEVIPSNDDIITAEDIKAATVIFDVDATCPDVYGVNNPYLYELVIAKEAISGATTDQAFRAVRCGSGDKWSYVNQVASHFEMFEGVGSIDREALNKLIRFGSFNDLDTSKLQPPATNDQTNVGETETSAEPETVVDSNPENNGSFKPNLTNTISFEVKVVNASGGTVKDWSSGSVSVSNGEQLYFRWSGTDYQQCLPFLNDNGNYALTVSNRAMVTGNTESEGYNVSERSAVYRVECGGQRNNEFGVDNREINVTVQ